MSDWIMGILVALFGLIGLTMGVGARDEEIFIFGFSLAAFSCAFIWGIFKRNAAARAAVTLRGGKHG